MSISADDLWAAIQAGRTTRLEWLAENARLEAIADTLTAMANTQGGTLLFGVSGMPPTVVGVREAENLIDRVIQAALQIDPPLIIPIPKTSQVQSHPVIVVTVPRGMPHVYSHDGRYLLRQGVDNIALKPRELRRLILERGEISFETEIARGASLDDLDWEKARQYTSTLGGMSDASAEGVLEKRGCLVSQEGRLRPTNAGMLLFGKEPQNFVRGAAVTAARFAGEAMSDQFSRQDITGTLPDQLHRTETFLVDHLRKNAHLGKSMARAEQLEYPLEAARELVVNAVAHRDYSIDGDGVRLFIYRDHMEVISPGGLPGPVTVDNIKDERFSRNPVIVQVLSDMGFIERLGYGVNRVFDLMREYRLREPEFSETAGGFRVTIFNQPRDGEVTEIPGKVHTHFDGAFRGIPINIRQEEALHHLTEGHSRITNSDLQEMCPTVHQETIRRDLADLVTKNILKKLGEKRGSYYVLRAENER